MKEKGFKEFIKEKATKNDACYYYKDYPAEVIESLENVYKACWRFCLRDGQIIYMLNEILKPYDLMGSLK